VFFNLYQKIILQTNIRTWDIHILLYLKIHRYKIDGYEYIQFYKLNKVIRVLNMILEYVLNLMLLIKINM